MIIRPWLASFMICKAIRLNEESQKFFLLPVELFNRGDQKVQATATWAGMPEGCKNCTNIWAIWFTTKSSVVHLTYCHSTLKHKCFCPKDIFSAWWSSLVKPCVIFLVSKKGKRCTKKTETSVGDRSYPGKTRIIASLVALARREALNYCPKSIEVWSGSF